MATSNLVIAEVHRLILFRAGIRAACVAIDTIGSSPTVNVVYATERHHGAARRWIERLDDQVISLTDAVSFAIMDDLKCRHALSFDASSCGSTAWLSITSRSQRAVRKRDISTE